MKEKLFNFITIRSITKSGVPARRRGKVIHDSKLETILTSSKPMDKKKDDILAYEKTIGGAAAGIAIPELMAFIGHLADKKFRTTVEEARVLMEKAFGKTASQIAGDAELRKKFDLVKSRISLSFLTGQQKNLTDLSAMVNVILLVEDICAGTLSPGESIAPHLSSTLLFPPSFAEFLAGMEQDKPEYTADPEAAGRSNRLDNLEKTRKNVIQALTEIEIRDPKEVKPILIRPEAGENGASSTPRIARVFTRFKTDKFSPVTLDLIKAQGLKMEGLNYEETEKIFAKMKTDLDMQIMDIRESAIKAPNRFYWNGTIFNLDDFRKPKPSHTWRPLIKKWNPYMRPLGLGELKTVEQVNVHYEAGEIAHIENILKGEKKERVHVKSTSVSTSSESETFREKATEHELETTSRHELSTETQKVVKESVDFDFKMHTDSKFGPWLELKTDTSLGYDNSREESKNVSASYAKEVVESAAEKIRESTREKRTVTVVTETTETNSHILDNTASPGHTVGIYRWIDKVYTAQVRSHDFRMLYEFIIPEPAAYYIYSNLTNPKQQFLLTEPEIPVSPDNRHPLTPADIDEYNYLSLAQKYGIRDITAPPSKEIVLTKSYAKKLTADENYRHITTLDFALPEGYSPRMILGAGILDPGPEQKALNLILSIGNENIFGNGLSFQNGTHNNQFTISAALDFDQVPSARPATPLDKMAVSMFVYHADSISMVLELHCLRRQDMFIKWQTDMYEKIMAAYYEMKADYDEKLRALEYSQGIVITGNNPLRNEDIQKTELKKHCISFMTMSYLDKYNSIIHILGDALSGEGTPEINFEMADKTAMEIQFFEQAFEWPQMMYRYYPYFWSDKKNWAGKMSIEPNDPQFGEFMRAGSARVILAVKPGYEEAVAHYFETGNILNGQHHIGIQDSLYQDIIDELKNEQSSSLGVVTDQWEVRLPTNLVVIDDDDAISRVSRILNR